MVLWHPFLSSTALFLIQFDYISLISHYIISTQMCFMKKKIMQVWFLRWTITLNCLSRLLKDLVKGLSVRLKES